MRKPVIALTAAAFATGALGLSLLSQAQDTAPDGAAAPAARGAGEMNPRQKTSYALGYDFGSRFKQEQIDIDLELFASGLRDAMGDGEGRLTDEQLQETLMAFSMEMQQKQMQRMQAEAEANAGAGAAFLAENSKKEGVQVTASGLQYKVIQPGEGDSPAMGDLVTVHYRLSLPDGQEIQNSRDTGQPAQFQVGGVIEGWNEALQMMKPGATWQLFIPADLAYGPQGRPPVIPPNATLIFDVELISFQPAPQQPGQM